MSKYNRLLHTKLASTLHNGRSVLLLGPRQTGKSTLMEAVCASLGGALLQYPLQLPTVRARLESDPESVLREAEASAQRPVVYIDEIQKLPALMDVLQLLIDRDKIVLAATGSSARKLRRGAVNWLPGRISLEHLAPLTWTESSEGIPASAHAAHLLERLLYGAMPGILSEPDLGRRRDVLSAYSAIYLEEEIRQEAAVRRLPPFAQFLKLAALESRTSPNLSKIAARVGVSHTAVRDYYQLLEDSLIVHRLGAFGKSRADVLRKARYYFFDCGVRNACAGLGHDPGMFTLQEGTLFEHFVVHELAAVLPSGSLSYWRTKRGDEVDAVVEANGRVIAIEVKATDAPKAADFSGLRAFQTAERCDRAFLVCQVERPQRFPDGTAWPWRDVPGLLGQ